jgi:hypothetical protein
LFLSFFHFSGCPALLLWKERKERKIPPEFSALYPVKDDWELEGTAQW